MTTELMLGGGGREMKDRKPWPPTPLGLAHDDDDESAAGNVVLLYY